MFPRQIFRIDSTDGECDFPPAPAAYWPSGLYPISLCSHSSIASGDGDEDCCIVDIIKLDEFNSVTRLS